MKKQEKSETKQMTGKEIVSLQKKMKKDGITINEALMFVFKEMIDKKSSQLQLQMANERGEEIEMNISIGGDMLKESDENKPVKPQQTKYDVPMVS